MSQRARTLGRVVETAAAIVPTYNEGANVARTVRAMRRVPGINEVVVVDGFSTDDTVKNAEAAGARVVQQARKVHPGKGIALQTGIEETDADAVLFFDADLANVDPAMPQRLLAPIFAGYDHTIGRYDRKAGRVTELTVKPLLRLLFPEVRFQQPLAGEYAFRRDAVRTLTLEPGWGVEAGLVIDVVMNGLRSKEVDLGFKDHAMKELSELGIMAQQAAKTILVKAMEHGRLERIGQPEPDAEAGLRPAHMRR